MRISIYQVDAFAAVPFTGNPAAICPLDEWLPDPLMQAIAAENNLAETAFFVREAGAYRLRWFTPAVEVDLCGHATLASAYILWEKLGFAGDVVTFETRSGVLHVTRDHDIIALDFPSRPPAACEVHPALLAALGGAPREVLAARDYFVVFDSQAEVEALTPNFAALSKVDRFAVIATAPGDEHDFVSRFFAPAQGIDEDPVTGSAHCTLTPYWSARLAKPKLKAKQISPRGGVLLCEDRGDRVSIAGKAVLYLEGSISV
ncbi:MAG: PhzF family phenazine biosynthesis protein [Bryobacterales bacterium]|nr:PhzF family phenazine biosynthesis protein [Bryobacterales bacterium]